MPTRIFTATMATLFTLALGGCADFDWRDMGRRTLQNYCDGSADCDRRCATETGARTVGDCRLSHGAP
ncbi:MAG: hypothetical protein PHS60_03960 [Zavarzinia sp.]|nr:hypothetical protein [Zavarzinia sp.]